MRVGTYSYSIRSLYFLTLLFLVDLPSPMSNLPQELIALIFSFVSKSRRDICICASICKLWYGIAMDQTLWQRMCFAQFPRYFWHFPKQSEFISTNDKYLDCFNYSYLS